MAANLSGWTARTLTPRAGLNDGSLGSRGPSSSSGTPVATASAFNPLQNSALFNLGQNQSMAFFQSLLSALGGGMGGAPAAPAPQMSANQMAAIDFARQMMGSEYWNRAKQAETRNFFSPTPAGAGVGLQGVSPVLNPMGGGLLPISNPVMEQFLSNQRLAPAVALGSAAASFGGNVGPQPRSGSGWSAPAFGF